MPQPPQRLLSGVRIHTHDNTRQETGPGLQMTPTCDPLVSIAQHLPERDRVGSPGPCSSEPCGSNLSEKADNALPSYLWGAHGKALNVDFLVC